MAARWRKEPSEAGLAKVCQLERGYQLRENGKTILSVGPTTRLFTRDIIGWSFAGTVNGVHVNTYDQLVPTKEEAKALADAWYKKHKKGAGDE